MGLFVIIVVVLYLWMLSPIQYTMHTAFLTFQFPTNVRECVCLYGGMSVGITFLFQQVQVQIFNDKKNVNKTQNANQLQQLFHLHI